MCPIRLECDDPTVTSWLGTWLADSQLEPPLPLLLRVAVRDPVAEEADGREPFRQSDVEIRVGPPQGDVRIRWLAAPAAARLQPGACTADVLLSSAAAERPGHCRRTFLYTVLVFLLRRAGWHHVHAATAIDPDGSAWLFAGDTCAGKSTTAALLASRGWQVGGDDASYLVATPTGAEVVAHRAPIALRQAGLALLGPQIQGRLLEERNKTAFFPEELGGTWVGRIRPDIIVLPVVNGATTRVERVRPVAALAELVRWSAWVALEPALAQPHLDLLARLAGQAPCWRVHLGTDLFGPRDLLRELVR